MSWFNNNVVKEPEIVNELCDQQVIDISYGYYGFHILLKYFFMRIL